MAVFRLYNSVGFGFDMSGTISANWIFAKGNQISKSHVISDNGKTRHVGIDGLPHINEYKVTYSVVGAKTLIEDVVYYNHQREIFKADNVNIKIGSPDFKLGSWFNEANGASDKFYGNNYTDVIKAGTGNDVVMGNAGNDKLYGELGNDKLHGGNGGDLLVGGSGSDYLWGGRGKDVLTGGADSDIFDFNAVQESVTGKNRDKITDFVSGRDHIDLRTIDADTDVRDGGKGNEAFIWIGGKDFSGVDGQLRLENGILQGDTNGDRKADFEIYVGVNKLVVTNSLETSDIWL